MFLLFVFLVFCMFIWFFMSGMIALPCCYYRSSSWHPPLEESRWPILLTYPGRPFQSYYYFSILRPQLSQSQSQSVSQFNLRKWPGQVVVQSGLCCMTGTEYYINKARYLQVFLGISPAKQRGTFYPSAKPQTLILKIWSDIFNNIKISIAHIFFSSVALSFSYNVSQIELSMFPCGPEIGWREVWTSPHCIDFFIRILISMGAS